MLFEAVLLVVGLALGLVGGTTVGPRLGADSSSVSGEEYEVLVDNVPQGVIALFDEDLQYRLTAGGAFEHIDHSVEDFEDHAIDDVHTEGFLDLHREKFERVFDGEGASFMFSHGERVYRTQLVPVREADGTIAAGMSLTTDITTLKQRERELRRQNERLEEFASIVSHDLRNPLDVAMGRLSVIDTEDDQHVRIIQEELQRMESIISDMLTLARHGQTVEDPTAIDLGVIAEEAWSHVDTPETTLENDVDYTVTADPDRVLQAFENLFRNAVEHGSTNPNSQARQDASEHAEEGVTVAIDDTAAGFYVEDDGTGIPATERDEVFDHGYTASDGGTGLGLAIVESVASAHGWSVSVTDSDAGGARFEFETERVDDEFPHDITAGD